jgi:hypothetical protein
MVDLSFESFVYVFGLVIALGYFAGVAGGIPLAIAAALLNRRVRPVWRAIAYVAVIPAVGVVALAVLSSGFDDPFGMLPGAVALAATLAALWGIPLLVGRLLLVRYTALSADRALYNALLGLPVALLVSLLVFVAPGGFARRNIVFLDGIAAVVAWAVFLAVLVFGPAVVGLAVARWRGGRKKAVVV